MDDNELARLRLKLKPETYPAIDPNEQHVNLAPEDIFGALEDLKRQKMGTGGNAAYPLPSQSLREKALASRVNRSPAAESYSATEDPEERAYDEGSVQDALNQLRAEPSSEQEHLFQQNAQHYLQQRGMPSDSESVLNYLRSSLADLPDATVEEMARLRLSQRPAVHSIEPVDASKPYDVYTYRWEENGRPLTSIFQKNRSAGSDGGPTKFITVQGKPRG